MSDMTITPDRESSARKLEGSDYRAQGASDRPVQSDEEWLKTCRVAYETSSDWLESIRKQWERAVDHFNGKHASGSKYHSEAYRARSRLFRPKTREVMRRREAAGAAAFFATKDVLSVQPVDEFDQGQREAAKINQELLQYHLTKTIPWFLTCVGALQDSGNYGVCISKQWWEFAEVDGKVTVDKPRIDLIAPENFRLDPASSWTDPVGSSPYAIEIVPMFVGAIRERQKGADPKTGQPAWKAVDDKLLREASRPEDISIRQARDKRQRADRRNARSQPIGDFEMVNVHANIVRKDGRDWLIYTLGTLALLSDPVPVEEVYPHLRRGERPYCMGVGMIETHKTYPFSQNDMIADLQIELNDSTNLRMDQSRLSVVGRYFARHGANVDIQSLTRAIPGAVTSMADPEKDVVVHRAPDVPASAYQEEDRINLATDAVVGHFSQNSVQTNRKLGETVGGMAMVSNSANQVLEYDLRVFAETWVEPVLSQVVRMEQTYETDQTVLAIAGKRAQVYAAYAGQLTPEQIEGEFTVSVDVGIGATDPNMKVQKFAQAMGMLGQLMQLTVPLYGPGVTASKGFQEISNEMFGLLGYKDAQRFLDFVGQQGDPQAQAAIQQLQAQVQELQQKLMQSEMEQKAGVEKEKAHAQGQIAVVREKGSVEIQVAQAKQMLGLVDKAADRAAGVDDREFGAEREDRAAEREDARAERERMMQMQTEAA